MHTAQTIFAPRIFIALLALLAFTAASPQAKAQDFLSQFEQFGSQDEDGNFFLDENAQQDEKPFVNQYNKKYKSSDGPQEINRGILPQSEYLASFVRTETTGPKQATFRIYSPVVLSGCLKMQQPTVSMQRNGKMIFVKIGEAAANVDRDVRYAHFQCDTRGQFATADIVFDLEEILDNGVKTVSFMVGPFNDYMDIEASKNRLTLSPKSTNAIKPHFSPQTKQPFSYYFYPENLVVLHGEGTEESAKAKSDLMSLAASKGLIKAEQMMPELKNKMPAEGRYYFIDTSDRYASQLDFGEQEVLGEIKVAREMRGPEGKYNVYEPMAVYIKRPDALD